MDLKQEIPFKTSIKEIIISEDAAAHVRNLKNTLVICDVNTEKFAPAGYKKHIFPHGVKPSLENAREISKLEADIFIAVGSGTINDITKYGAFLAGKSYIAYATAASMNGYASGGASLLENGHKKSFIAKPAAKVVMDLTAIKAAPPKMRVAGICDAYCRLTVEADNLLANKIRGDEYFGKIFAMLKKYEEQMFDNIEALCKTLIFGGIAMNIAGSSAPASQGEHMLAHYMEMMQPTAPHSLHGQQIAVTMLSMAKLIEAVGNEVLVKNYDEVEFRKHFGNSDFTKDAKAKYENIASKKFKIQKPIINAAGLEAKLKSIGAPTTPEQIGWDKNIYNNALEYARYTRNRLTYLDVQ